MKRGFPAMRRWTERFEEACRHVTEGRRIVDGQRALIERQKASGHDTNEFEHLLASFESAQQIFESDLARIQKERN
jgi:hypothetical protein